MLARLDQPPRPEIVLPTKLVRAEQELAAARAERERLRTESAPMRAYVASTQDREVTKQLAKIDVQIAAVEETIVRARVARAKLVRDFSPEVDRQLHPWAARQARRLLSALNEATAALAELQSCQPYCVAPHFANAASQPHKDVSRIMAKIGQVDSKPLASLSAWAAEFLPEQERG
ncbi:hypothetical protein [Mesorhizobium sp. CN2-181]|uniref:hypothetical protein n=1 Tax=Mesorhizobium yinganensis TaxID=3157707 RepID=UPI0032B80333